MQFAVPEINDLIINAKRDREFISDVVTQHSSDFLSTRNRCRTYQHLPYPLLRRLRSFARPEHILIVSHNKDAIRCIQHVLIYYICEMIRNQGSRRSWFTFRNITSTDLLLTRKVVFSTMLSQFGISGSGSSISSFGTIYPSVTFCDINDVMHCRQIAMYLSRFTYVIWDAIDPYVDLLIRHLGTEHQRLLDVLGNISKLVRVIRMINRDKNKRINYQQVYNVYPCVFPEYCDERVVDDEQMMNMFVPMITSNQSSIASLMKIDLARTIGKVNWKYI